jgi:anti-sigma B factor antagonist
VAATSAHSFSVETLVEPNEPARVRVAGDVDMATASELRNALDEVERSDAIAIVIDLGDVTFIDSSGLHVLLMSARRCERRQIPLTAVHLPHHVRRLFSLVALDQTLVVN